MKFIKLEYYKYPDSTMPIIGIFNTLYITMIRQSEHNDKLRCLYSSGNTEPVYVKESIEELQNLLEESE